MDSLGEGCFAAGAYMEVAHGCEPLSRVPLFSQNCAASRFAASSACNAIHLNTPPNYVLLNYHFLRSQEAGNSPRTISCLKYLLLANM